MIPYSTRFLAWAAEESPPAYVVPAGYIAVIRDIDVTTGGGAETNWVAGIAEVVKITGGQFTIEALLQHQQWQGRQIVNAGEAIYFAADGSTDGAISGYLLASTSA